MLIPSFSIVRRTISVIAFTCPLLFTTTLFALPFDLLYSTSLGNDVNGQYVTFNTGRVAAPYLSFAPVVLNGGISGPGFNLESFSEAGGYVSPGLITGSAVARVFNAVGDVFGLADAEFNGLFEDTLVPDYTGIATFTIVLDSTIGESNNGIEACYQQSYVDAEFKAQSGTSSFDVPVARLPCDGTQNSYTWMLTLPAVIGQPISVYGNLDLSAGSYGDPNVGDGYSYADASNTAELFVQDVGGSGTFTAASGHDYSPLAAVPEPSTIYMFISGSFYLAIGIHRRRRSL